MSIFDRFTRGQFVDVIEWLDDSQDTMVYRFQRFGNEIKYGAMLTVRPGQMAVMVNEGEIADVFEPGLWQLDTANMPILSTLQAWKHGFESPFKTEVYFVNMKRFTDLKWGTKNPIMLRDAEFGPVRLRAFGTYEIVVKDPGVFLTEIVGTDGRFTVDEVADQLRNLIVSRLAVALGKSNIPALDLAANYMELGEFIVKIIGPDFEQYGLELTKLMVENVSLPPNVEEALDKRSSMGVIGDLNKYMQFQAAESLTASGGGAGAAQTGAGLGMGMAMAQQMANAFQVGHQPPAAPAPAPSAAPAPPPVPQGPQYYVAVNGQQTGPFDDHALMAEIAAGRCDADTLVWAAGMPAWTAAKEVPALARHFQSAPPPIPGM